MSARILLARFSILFIILLALVSVGVSTGNAADIKVSQTIVETVVPKPFNEVNAKLQAAIKAARFMVIGNPNYQMMQRMVGRERRPAEAYYIFRPDLGTPIFDNDYNAAMEVPIKILIYQNDSGQTVIRYKKPSSSLADYKGLGTFGQQLDKMVEQIVSSASS